MSRTISHAKKIELPSLHDVFELKEAIPQSKGGAIYWQIKGLYILDKKARLLCGLTQADESEAKAYHKLHLKLRRYYEGRTYISALNHAKEGWYFHRDQVEEQGVLLSEYYKVPPQKLKIEDLKLLHAIYTEMIRYRDNFDLRHQDIQPKDVLILAAKRLNIWQRLGLKAKYEVLFLNFLPASKAPDQEESLHQMLADLIGPAYLNEFNQPS
ncbi:MAG: hypothetical protein AAF927_06535 [Bacteroidota bacterium]